MDFVKIGKKFIALSISLFFFWFSVAPVFAVSGNYYVVNAWQYILKNRASSNYIFRFYTPSRTSSSEDYTTNSHPDLVIRTATKGNGAFISYDSHDYPGSTYFEFLGVASGSSHIKCQIYWSESLTSSKYKLWEFDTQEPLDVRFSYYDLPISLDGNLGVFHIRWVSDTTSETNAAVPFFIGFDNFKDSSDILMELDEVYQVTVDISDKLSAIQALVENLSSGGETVSDLDDTGQILDENVNEFENLESGFLDDMNNSLDQLPSIDFTLNDFGSTALFVSNQMQSLYDSSNYIQFIIITPLIIGIALILIGRRDH